MRKYIHILIFVYFSLIFAQENASEIKIFDYKVSSQNYVTDEKGNVLMYVNVWGTVGTPGRLLVYEGIDLATLLSIVGGPVEGANMRKVRLYREIPDDNNNISYVINLESFIKTGDRSEFLKIKPNDTVVIPSTLRGAFLNQVGTLNTIFSLLNLYLAMDSRLKN